MREIVALVEEEMARNQRRRKSNAPKMLPPPPNIPPPAVAPQGISESDFLQIVEEKEQLKKELEALKTQMLNELTNKRRSKKHKKEKKEKKEKKHKKNHSDKEKKEKKASEGSAAESSNEVSSKPSIEKQDSSSTLPKASSKDNIKEQVASPTKSNSENPSKQEEKVIVKSQRASVKSAPIAQRLSVMFGGPQRNSNRASQKMAPLDTQGAVPDSENRKSRKLDAAEVKEATSGSGQKMAPLDVSSANQNQAKGSSSPLSSRRVEQKTPRNTISNSSVQQWKKAKPSTKSKPKTVFLRRKK